MNKLIAKRLSFSIWSQDSFRGHWSLRSFAVCHMKHRIRSLTKDLPPFGADRDVAMSATTGEKDEITMSEGVRLERSCLDWPRLSPTQLSLKPALQGVDLYHIGGYTCALVQFPLHIQVHKLAKLDIKWAPSRDGSSSLRIAYIWSHLIAGGKNVPCQILTKNQRWATFLFWWPDLAECCFSDLYDLSTAFNNVLTIKRHYLFYPRLKLSSFSQLIIKKNKIK